LPRGKVLPQGGHAAVTLGWCGDVRVEGKEAAMTTGIWQSLMAQWLGRRR